MKVKFPAGAFLDADGLPVSGEVTVRLIELYSKTDIMLAGLSTESHSDLLESGGEFYLMAEKDGEELTLNPLNGHWTTDPVLIDFPVAPDNAPDMLLFTGGLSTLDPNELTSTQSNARLAAHSNACSSFPSPAST